ncbi:YkvA family protein [Streptomyces sp. NPDC021224]|uniref:YkvA family protein n=1 Tax=unclassified Streptomyces TaxID=2593676 RepID=UPI0037B7A0C1
MDGRERLLLWLAAVLAVIGLVIALRLLIRLIRTWRLLKASGVPIPHKAMFWASVAYLVCPVDLLPDPVYLDDIGVLLLALRSLNAAARRYGIRPARDGGSSAPHGKDG